MKALLLAAGFGTRLKPITDSIPKCLVPIRGIPLLQYWLDNLCPLSQLEEIWINTHYLRNQVEAFIRNSPWRSKVRLLNEPELLGTAGTLRTLKDELSVGHRPVLVAHADNLSCFDPRQLLLFHETKPKNVEITMMTFETDSPQSCGIVELDSTGIVQVFHEKVQAPPGNLANAAVYVFDFGVLEFISSLPKKRIDISEDVLPHYMGKIQTFENLCYHRDIGSPESLAKADWEFPSSERPSFSDRLCARGVVDDGTAFEQNDARTQTVDEVEVVRGDELA